MLITLSDILESSLALDVSILIHRTISIPSYFAAPVFIEDAEIENAFIYLRVRTDAGEIVVVTITPEEIQQALAATTASQVEVVSGHEQSLLVEAERIRLAYAFDPHFAVSL